MWNTKTTSRIFVIVKVILIIQDIVFEMYQLSRRLLQRELRLSLKQNRFFCDSANQESENDTKTEVLLASLKFVPQHGWTTTSLAEGILSDLLNS